MNVQEALHKLDLGNSVAEFDQELERYFVETDTFRTLIEDKRGFLILVVVKITWPPA